MGSLTLTNHGRIQGKGGKGGWAATGSPPHWDAGSPGGGAFLAEHEISIDNLDGEIWGGGGGGGAGGLFFDGGGGGAGTEGGEGGVGFSYAPYNGYGDPGTTDAGGLGFPQNVGLGYSSGGNGGGPGLPGAAGADGDNPGAAGGAAGKYVSGNELVTWINAGDRRGGVS